MTFFRHHLAQGCKYALLFVGVSAVMGALYGLFGGRLVSPMIFAITLTGIFVVLNFIVALAVGVVNLLFILFNQRNNAMMRYAALSSGFLIVYLLFFAILKVTGVTVF